MTWVFGTATNFFGTAMAVADIQVTFDEDETLDCLRKLYVIDQNLVAGFAGDVAAGFEMLAVLQAFVRKLRGESERPVDLSEVFELYPTAAEAAYGRFDTDLRRNGCAVLIAGASPVPDLIYGGRPQVCRFESPKFRVDEIPRGEWGSIGSGSDVAQYRAELEALTGPEADDLIKMEVNRPGFYAHVMSISILQSVFEMPSVKGISKHFHSCVVTAGGFECRGSDRTLSPPGGEPRQIAMPPVATSWAGLQELLRRRLGRAPARAIA